MRNVKCRKCKTDIVIKENELFFSEEENDEVALCPICSSIVFEGRIDGWYFVQTLESFEKENIDKPNCVFPMP